MTEPNPWIPLVIGGAAFGFFMLRRPSEHFTWEEWTTTNTGIDNSIYGDLPSMIRAALTSRQVLEQIRPDTGPLTINSGYRSKAVNDDVKGSSTSQHLFGDGVDLEPPSGWTAEELAEYLWQREDLPLKQVIWYSPGEGGHVHIGRDSSGAPGAREFYYKDGSGYTTWTGYSE
jgi:hypothetical protein